MSAYTDSTGRKWRGNARPEDVENYVAFERRLAFAAELRKRLDGYGAQSALARACGVSPACISNILDGSRGTSADIVDRMADALGVTDKAERDRWLALAGHLPQDIAAALIAQPDAWDDVRALLAARGRP